MEQKIVRTGLRKRWGFAAVAAIAGAIVGFTLLSNYWDHEYALRWLAISSLILAYILSVLWLGLGQNHRPGEEMLLPGLGAGNWMTLLRGGLLAALMGFLFSPWPPGSLAWLPGILYCLAVGADFLDGYLARRTNHVTRLGTTLDLSFDGLGVFGAALLAVLYGQTPFWYLSVSLARYVFLAGLAWRKRRGLPVYDLPPSVRRRAFAGVQMGFIAAILLPVFSPPATYLAAALFALPFLLSFLYDWGLVSGILSPMKASVSLTARVITRWLPVILRVAVILLAARPLSQRLSGYSDPIVLFNQTSMPSAETGVFALAVLEALVLLMLLLGAAGRIMAIAGLILLGIHQVFAPLVTNQVLLVAGYTAILFMGTGAFSFWKPEEKLIHDPAGERRVVEAPSQ